MNIAIDIDTNMLVRLEEQFKAAESRVDQAVAADEPILIMLLLCTLLETEWVLCSRYKLDNASIAGAFAQLLERRDVDVIFEHKPTKPTLEEVLYVWAQHPSASASASTDFADCLLNARATHLGHTRFVTFDVVAATLPRAELLQ